MKLLAALLVVLAGCDVPRNSPIEGGGLRVLGSERRPGTGLFARAEVGLPERRESIAESRAAALATAAVEDVLTAPQIVRSELVWLPTVEERPIRELPANRPPTATDFERVATGFTQAWLVELDGRSDATDDANWIVFLDAGTGRVLRRHDATLRAAPPVPPPLPTGTGQSFFRGNVPIGSTSGSQTYTLCDENRPGACVYSARDDFGALIPTLYEDDDNRWGTGQPLPNMPVDPKCPITWDLTDTPAGQTDAVDVSYGMIRIYDMYERVLGWSGYDGNGHGVAALVHVCQHSNRYRVQEKRIYISAFQAGATHPFTDIEMVGHEWAHAVFHSVYPTAAEYYAGEPGGVNEANSDIMGTMADFFASAPIDATTIPNGDVANWIHGDSLGSKGDKRYLDRPSRDGLSLDAWRPGLSPSIDGHYTSGVINRMFYFLSTGADTWLPSNPGDRSSQFLPQGMTGLGNNKAALIWHTAVVNHMLATCDFVCARTALETVAISLYGANSVEHRAVQDAFGAVNVGLPADREAPIMTFRKSQNGDAITIAGQIINDQTAVVFPVPILIDGILRYTANSSPYQFTVSSALIHYGNRVFEAHPKDTLGQVRDFKVTFLSDVGGPTVTHTAVESTGSVTINGTVSDPCGVQLPAQILIDGQVRGSVDSGTWSVVAAEPLFVAGTHTLPIVVSDRCGHQTDYVRVFGMLPTPPVFGGITVVRTDALHADIRPVVTDNLGVAKVQLFEGATFLGEDTTTVQYDLPVNLTGWTAGTHTLTVKATDLTGYTTTATTSLLVDTTPPVVTLSSAQAGGILTLSGTISDVCGLVTPIPYAIDGVAIGTIPSSPFALHFLESQLAVGPHTFSLVAQDQCGNANPFSSLFAFQVTPPSIQSITVDDSDPLHPRFTVVAIDNLGIQKVTVSRNNLLLASDTTAPYEFQLDVTGWATGPTLLRFSALDVTNVITDSDLTITLPLGSPPTIGTITVDTTVKKKPKLTVPVTDDIAVAKVEVLRAGSVIATDSAAPFILEVDTSTWPSGPSTLTVRATDSSGQATNKTVTVVADNTPPTLTTTMVRNGLSYTFSSTASDPSGIDYVRCGVYLFGPPATSSYMHSPPFVWTFTAPADGSQGDTLGGCWANDTYGNTTNSPEFPVVWP